MVVPPIDIYSLVFQILGVSSRVTGTFQTDFLNLIFFPHIVIIIWLYLIARGPVFMALHKGFGTLLSISIYIFIVWYGWYSVIASLSMIWLTVTIIVSFFYFMITKLLHPSSTEARFGLGRLAGHKLMKGHEIDKAIARLKIDAVSYDKLSKDLEKEIPTATPERQKSLQEEIKEMDLKKLSILSEIRRLESEKKVV